MLVEQQGAIDAWAALPFCHKTALENAQDLSCAAAVWHRSNVEVWLLTLFPVHVQAAAPNTKLFSRSTSMMASLLSMQGSSSGLPAAAMSLMQVHTVLLP